MGGNVSCTKSSAALKDSRLIDLIFSWSLDDILNGDLYKHKVESIPDSFQSVEHYFNSFLSPLLEEIRAELSSKMEALPDAPFAQVISVNEATPSGKRMYDVKLDHWRNSSSPNGKESYRSSPGHGDIVVFAEEIPKSVSDLKQVGRSWCFGYITRVSRDDGAASFRIKASKEIDTTERIQMYSIVVFVTTITTNKRIWDALHLFRNLELFKEILSNSEDHGNCELCPMETNQTMTESLSLTSSDLNESQYEAVSGCIRKIHCNHKPSVELIWGPPGTGKTRTVSVLLFGLLKSNCRTLVCTPTNVAIVELASRVAKLVREKNGKNAASYSSFCCLGDVLLFGKKDQITPDVEDIYLNHRIEKLADCFGSRGWKHSFCSTIDFLEDSGSCDEIQERQVDVNSLIQSRRDQFESILSSLKRNVYTLFTHMPKRCILPRGFEKMESLFDLLDSIKPLFPQGILPSEDISRLLCKRDKCLCDLKEVRLSLDKLNLPNEANRDLLEEFCFREASLIFCTTSSSYKLHSMGKDPVKCLVIDEAAQLKECESTIPLQIPGALHVVLIGDECQLTATVNSKVSQKAGLGRSLFERLSLLGRPKHLLDIQYRMHPSISSFPNSKFYQNRIVNAPSVKGESYRKHYLPNPMFGPYSFVNISGGKDLVDATGSRKNFVEVAVVFKIVQLLYKACDASNEKVSVGVVSPYSAQVAAIEQKLGQKFERNGNFSVKVRSIDGFQGGEEDIVIVSTVRSNKGGFVGFMSNPQRTNVALTRARHALWILGNEITLSNSGSIWEEVIIDAKVRQCFFHADEHKELAKVIMDVKKELGQLEDLLNGDSALFRNAKWKVLFSDNFRKSFSRLRSLENKNLALLMLSKLASGWRPKGHVGVACESPSQMLKQFKVGDVYIVCSVDIVKESWYIQALKVWDILGLQEIGKLVTRLERIFAMHSDDYLNRCKVKCFQRDLEVPMTWPASLDINQFKNINSSETKEASDERNFEDSKVRDSLLLMKFYSLSSGAVHKMLSSCDGGELGIPFELTEQEKEIVFFDRSSFILGRSGTGKTTVLTMKLFQNEQLYHIAAEGFHEVHSDPAGNACSKYEVKENDEDTKGDFLHQLFVTVSPKLCYAVNQHVSQLKRSICEGKSSAQSSSIQMDDINATVQFTQIPDSFVDLQPEAYPLIITFHKFLLMLDGTVGSSYFDRFQDVRLLDNSKSRSVVLETFIRTKEVTYDRFDSSYWPHFNIMLTRNLDSSTVFTEIMSVIKGGLGAGDAPAGKLCQQDYISLAENRGSSLSIKKREMIYPIYLEYEKKKVGNGEFDLADLVLDLHHRLNDKRYEGDEMDFVYIDEVQDLSMRQIALFKYVCKNVDEGFAFAGDTAQTIAKGIEFRFEDIRSLFYKEFIFGSRRNIVGKRREEKGKISRIFHLSQNFRTHAAVLKLAQSVINLLYHYFPTSIDILSPEISLLSGEAPILLGTEDNKNVLKSIFEKSGDAGGRVDGFGAEQVVLVRDENVKKEIRDDVGKKALVLTITECKGLEFQDVLLYGFFSSSPVKDAWRLVYGFMKEKELLNSETNIHSASFDQEKHKVLCSELKLLYVAITRTKQRLWISDESHLPMFNYWKTLCLVRERKLDESFLKEMQVGSSREEWRSRGIKLFSEHNYEAALMCFERAGDTFWETLAKASGFRATADRLRASDSARSTVYLKEAAELFYSIGKAESAAQCFVEMKEYKRAGTIYLESFGDEKLEKAGECFSMAKCYKLSVEAYARARLYSKCLSVCLKGKLFDMGLQYLESWKQHEPLRDERILQDFLHRGALHYFELNKKWNMMKFVKSFHSKDLIRTFLKDVNCLDELLLLEEEWGNFKEAADIARIKKDSLREADLLEKAGFLREASALVLWYVFSNFLSPPRPKYKPGGQKDIDELLVKAKSSARKHSVSFYELVSMLADMLSKEKTIEEDPETALEFVQCWKKNAPADLETVKAGDEYIKLEKYLLQKCACKCHRKNDRQNMMKYVELFQTFESKRSFLKGFNCLDELLLLEEHEGNFLEAAKIAVQKGDTLHEFDLLEKAGDYKEASMLMLLYVSARSLWALGSRGWPLKEFTQKEYLLAKAVSCAIHHSDVFHTFVSTEAKVLSGLQCSLSEMREFFILSQRINSCSGEILSARKILDAHLRTSPHKYEWDDLSVDNLSKHLDNTSPQDRVSVHTLVSIWNYWKEKIVRVVDSLAARSTNDGRYFTRYKEFCIIYLGLRRHWSNDTRYVVLNPDASWLKEIDSRSIQRNGQLVSVDAWTIPLTAQNYWSSELLSVGIDVLVTLKSLYLYSMKRNFSLFQQSLNLLCMFEVAKFLKNYEFPNKKYGAARNAEQYVELSIENFLENVFHMDWRKSSTKELISLRGSECSVDLIKEAISKYSMLTSTLTYGKMGWVLMMMLGSGQQTAQLDEKFVRSFAGNSTWMRFFEKFLEKTSADSKIGCLESEFNVASSDLSVSLIFSFRDVLQDIFHADWRNEADYISPSCFIYLLERLLILVSCFRGYFFTTKSSCLEWMIHGEWKVSLSACSVSKVESSTLVEDIHTFIAFIVSELLLNKNDTMEWIKKSNIHSEDLYPLLILRLVILLCLICVNGGKHTDSLFNLLARSDVRSLLPTDFCNALHVFEERSLVHALADALKKVENPLVVVNLTDDSLEYSHLDIIFLNGKTGKFSKETLIDTFFKDKPQTATILSERKFEHLAATSAACVGDQDPDNSGRKYGVSCEETG